MRLSKPPHLSSLLSLLLWKLIFGFSVTSSSITQQWKLCSKFHSTTTTVDHFAVLAKGGRIESTTKYLRLGFSIHRGTNERNLRHCFAVVVVMMVVLFRETSSNGALLYSFSLSLSPSLCHCRLRLVCNWNDIARALPPARTCPMLPHQQLEKMVGRNRTEQWAKPNHAVCVFVVLCCYSAQENGP